MVYIPGKGFKVIWDPMESNQQIGTRQPSYSETKTYSSEKNIAEKRAQNETNKSASEAQQSSESNKSRNKDVNFDESKFENYSKIPVTRLFEQKAHESQSNQQIDTNPQSSHNETKTESIPESVIDAEVIQEVFNPMQGASDFSSKPTAITYSETRRRSNNEQAYQIPFFEEKSSHDSAEKKAAEVFEKKIQAEKEKDARIDEQEKQEKETKEEKNDNNVKKANENLKQLRESIEKGEATLQDLTKEVNEAEERKSKLKEEVEEKKKLVVIQQKATHKDMATVAKETIRSNSYAAESKQLLLQFGSIGSTSQQYMNRNHQNYVHSAQEYRRRSSQYTWGSDAMRAINNANNGTKRSVFDEGRDSLRRAGFYIPEQQSVQQAASNNPLDDDSDYSDDEDVVVYYEGLPVTEYNRRYYLVEELNEEIVTFLNRDASEQYQHFCNALEEGIAAKYNISKIFQKKINVHNLNALVEYHNALKNSYGSFHAWEKEVLLPQLRKHCDNEEQLEFRMKLVGVRRKLEEKYLHPDHVEYLQIAKKEAQAEYDKRFSEMGFWTWLFNEKATTAPWKVEKQAKIDGAFDAISEGYKIFYEEQFALEAADREKVEEEYKQAEEREKELVQEKESIAQKIEDEKIAVVFVDEVAKQEQMFEMIRADMQEMERREAVALKRQQHEEEIQKLLEIHRNKNEQEQKANTDYEEKLQARSEFEKKKSKNIALQEWHQQRRKESAIRLEQLSKKIRPQKKSKRHKEDKPRVEVIDIQVPRDPEDTTGDLTNATQQLSIINKELKAKANMLHQRAIEESQQRLEKLTKRLRPSRKPLSASLGRVRMGPVIPPNYGKEKEFGLSFKFRTTDSEDNDDDPDAQLAKIRQAGLRVQQRLEDLGVTIYEEKTDPTQNLDVISPDSVDFSRTHRGEVFLESVGINPVEFLQFTGNEEQNDMHKLLMQHANQGLDFITTSGSRKNARKVQDLALLVFKTSYDLNKKNYPEFARKLIELELYNNPATLIPAIGKEVAHTILHPLEYVQRRLQEIPAFISSEDLGFFEKYDKIEDAVNDIVQRTNALNAAQIPQTIPEHQKRIAQNTIDYVVDGLLMYAGGRLDAARINRALRNVAPKPRELQPIKGKFIRFLDDAFESLTHPALDADVTALVKTSRDVASKITEKTSLPVSLGKTSRSKFLDFSEVTKSFDSSKKVARRTKPYKEIKRKLAHKIAAKKALQSSVQISTVTISNNTQSTNISTQAINQQNIGNTAALAQRNALIIQNFNAGLMQLEQKYNKALLQEAITILKLDNDRVFVKMKNPVDLLEYTTQALVKIDSAPRWKTFRFDPANNYKCEYKNVEEALAGVACEEQGLLTDLIRDSSGNGEFIDPSGQVWDVKTAKSEALNGDHIFNDKGAKEFFESIIKELGKPTNENLIINISYLQKTKDKERLYNALRALPNKEVERIIIVDVVNPSNSKTSTELSEFIGKN